MCYHTKIKDVQPRLVSFVKSRVFSLHDAQDIIQNVNVILVNKKDEYNKNKNFNSWALRIAEFQIRAHFTKSKRSKTTPSPMEEQDSFENANLTNYNCPASIMENNEKAEKFRKRIFIRKKLLSKNQLQVINLYCKGLKYKEIAEALNIPISTVSATKSRAIQRMKI